MKEDVSGRKLYGLKAVTFGGKLQGMTGSSRRQARKSYAVDRKQWTAGLEGRRNGEGSKYVREGGLAEEEKRKDWKPDGPGISLEKVWKKGDVVEFYPEMKVHATRWAHGSLAVERGPLVYGLDIRERWEKVKQTGMFFDFDVYPETPWNYALDAKQEFQVEERMVGPVPFSKAEAPVVLTGKGRRISRWKLEHHSAGKLPESPAQADCPEEKIRLLPFGCTKLRISQFPWYKS